METTPSIRFAPEYELPHWPFTAPPELAAGASRKGDQQESGEDAVHAEERIRKRNPG